MIRWISGKTGKTEAHDVQTPLPLSGASHQKQSGRVTVALAQSVFTVLATVVIPTAHEVMFFPGAFLHRATTLVPGDSAWILNGLDGHLLNGWKWLGDQVAATGSSLGAQDIVAHLGSPTRMSYPSTPS
jgi:hypothetical protein